MIQPHHVTNRMMESNNFPTPPLFQSSRDYPSFGHSTPPLPQSQTPLMPLKHANELNPQQSLKNNPPPLFSPHSFSHPAPPPLHPAPGVHDSIMKFHSPNSSSPSPSKTLLSPSSNASTSSQHHFSHKQQHLINSSGVLSPILQAQQSPPIINPVKTLAEKKAFLPAPDVKSSSASVDESKKRKKKEKDKDREKSCVRVIFSHILL